MRRLIRFLVLLLVAASFAHTVACRGTQISALKLPPPQQSTMIGPGDLFKVSVLGEKDLPTEYRVQPDGTIDFPYLDRLTVAGLEPQEIADLIKRGLVAKKILIDPQLTLVVTQYNSKKISIVGAV